MFVKKTGVFLYSQPSVKSEAVDEVLHGWQCQICENVGQMCRVMTEYGYCGYTFPENLSKNCPKGEVWEVVCDFADLLLSADHRAPIVATLPRGARVWCADGGGKYTALYNWQGIAWIENRSIRKKEHPKFSKFPSRLREKIVSVAFEYLGAPYRWAGKTNMGIDCSGLAFMAYSLCGITINRDAVPNWSIMRKISLSAAGPADLIYYDGHVALYLGDGKIIHSSLSQNRVVVENLFELESYDSHSPSRIRNVATVF